MNKYDRALIINGFMMLFFQTKEQETLIIVLGFIAMATMFISGLLGFIEEECKHVR